MEYHWEFFLREEVTFSKTFIFFVTALSFLSHFRLYTDRITFTKFSLSYSGCISTVSSSGPVSTFPTPCSFFYSPIYGHSICYHLALHCISYLCSLSVCGKCHVSLSLGDKEAARLHALLSCELNNRHAVIDLWQILKEVPWWVTHQDGHLLSDCGLKSKQEICTDAPAQLTRCRCC